MRKFYGFDTMFTSLKDGLRALLKSMGIYYELSDGRGCFDTAMVWHFEINATEGEVEIINAWLDENTIWCEGVQ